MHLRPLAEPLPFALHLRGRQYVEAFARLTAQEQLELACRNVLGVLAMVRARFERTRLET